LIGAPLVEEMIRQADKKAESKPKNIWGGGLKKWM
jgi:hypothetical protein